MAIVQSEKKEVAALQIILDEVRRRKIAAQACLAAAKQELSSLNSHAGQPSARMDQAKAKVGKYSDELNEILRSEDVTLSKLYRIEAPLIWNLMQKLFLECHDLAGSMATVIGQIHEADGKMRSIKQHFHRTKHDGPNLESLLSLALRKYTGRPEAMRKNVEFVVNRGYSTSEIAALMAFMKTLTVQDADLDARSDAV